MLLSTREAVKILRAHGVGSDSARRALARGLAGPSTRIGAVVAYDLDAVEALAARPAIRLTEVFDLVPRGVFLARVDVDLTSSPADQREWLEQQWTSMSPWSLLNRRLEITEFGPLPLIATTGTFVTVGADVVDVIPLGGRRRLVLAPPGDWFALVAGRRLRGAAGRPWDVYGPARAWPV